MALTVVGGDAGSAELCLNDDDLKFGDCGLCTEGGGVMLLGGGGDEKFADFLCLPVAVDFTALDA